MRSGDANAVIPQVVEEDPAQLWFGSRGYVLRTSEDTYCVMMGSTLLGDFEAGDAATRDVLITMVMRNVGGGVAWVDVAKAFRVGRSTVGRAMQRLGAGGLPAVADTGHKGGLTKRTAQLERRVFKLFDAGLGVRAAHRVVRKRISYGTVHTLHREWVAKRAAECAPPAQRALVDLVVPSDETRVTANDNGDRSTSEEQTRVEDGLATGTETATDEGERSDPLGMAAEPSPQALARKERAPEELLDAGRSELVQHAGSWILLALLCQLGVYDEAAQWSGKVSRPTLRVVFDIVAIALAIGEKCVEGARRIATPSAPLLLRHSAAIGPGWVRRVLGCFAAEAALAFRARVSAMLLQRSAAEHEHAWLYVDNHPRKYTGKETLRKIWRMQSKRAVPGTMDYYVHDEDGHPLWRVTAADHAPLAIQLGRTVDFARMTLGQDADILLSFDRGASNPQTLAALRDSGVSFVTYEKKPYPTLPESAFKQQLEIVLPSRPGKPIPIRYAAARDRNLRKGRGRVRRIALLTDDGTQINLLTSSTLPPEEIIPRHLARWGKQENQFKHGVERWGINQLDGRQVEAYPADAVIPNPDRRHIDRKIKLARLAEGRARCLLAELADDAPDRERLRKEIEDAISRRQELEALRPSMPARAPVERTSLAGKLVRHTTGYKDVLDTLRIAFANVEADLAAALASGLDRPREAKKVVANLFAAPGAISLGKNSWRVRLMPAARPDEHDAIAGLLAALNRQQLVLPGDPTGRVLHFSLARSPHR